MSIALPLLILAALIVVAVFWVRAQSLAKELSLARAELTAIGTAHAELKESAQQRSQKDKTKGSEVEELREKQKDLRRRLGEAQDQAKKLKEQEGAVRETAQEARTQADHARAEAAEASQLMRAMRAELEQLRGRRAIRPEPIPEASATPAPVQVVPAAPAAKPGPEVADLELKLKERDTRLVELDVRVKSEQRKTQEAAREIERLKAKGSTSEKLYIVQKGELELWKDRYRMLEQRLNKTLREVDALHRGVLALERRLPQKSVEEARAEVVQAQAEADKQAQAAEEAKAAAEAKADAAATEAAATSVHEEAKPAEATPEA